MNKAIEKQQSKFEAEMIKVEQKIKATEIDSQILVNKIAHLRKEMQAIETLITLSDPSVKTSNIYSKLLKKEQFNCSLKTAELQNRRDLTVERINTFKVEKEKLQQAIV